MANLGTNMTKTTDLTASQKEVAARTFMLEVNKLHDDVFYRYALKTNFRPDSDTYTWRRYNQLPKTTASLTEGVSPTALKTTMVEFKTKVNMEGAYVEISDKLLTYGLDDQLVVNSELLGENAFNRLNDIIYTKLQSGCNVMYADGTTSNETAAAKTFTLADLVKIKAMFKRYGVKPVEGGKYILVAAPEVIADFLKSNASNASFIDISKYTNPKEVIDGEVGTIMGFRIVESNLIQPVSGTPSAGSGTYTYYPCLAFGRDAFGTLSIDGTSADANGVEIIYHGLNEAGGALNQFATLGWKHNGFGARILRDEALCRYVVGASTATAPDLEEDDLTDVVSG